MYSKNPSTIILSRFLFVIAAIAWSCSGLDKASVMTFVVRETPGNLITKPANIEFSDTQSGKSIGPFKTNSFGYLALDKDSLQRKHKMNFDRLEAKAVYNGKTASIRTDEFNGYYDIYLEPVRLVHDTLRAADMHYHVSLRTYNAFGNDLYHKTIPKNINWLRIEKNLRVFDGKRWSKINLLEAQKDTSILKTYLKGNWVRPAEGANNLKHFSEATFPHTLEGNVYIAYNAISPFEHGLTNERVKRAVSSSMKSGADIDWLKMLGDNDNHITHWQNFLAEYNMINDQAEKFNNYEWRTYNSGNTIDDMLKKTPVVVNVVEGAHIFQDKYFPHAINFDLLDTTSRHKKDLFEEIRLKSKKFARTNMEDAMVNDLFEMARNKSNGKKDSLVNWLLMHEVLTNVDSFKQLEVHMISISHLSYNGMTGHAPALDVSKKPAMENFTSYLAKRAFGIRVSNDKKYKKSYDGLFYRVPGVNQFGDSVMSHLLDITNGGKRVHIDMKHADVLTRRNILDRYEKETMKSAGKIKLPPMCSHCAVNGLSIDYTSPLLNEYSLLKSSLARKFYPFAINLYNEEIERMVALGGMIGIPLEERVLGGYINNKQQWYYGINKKGDNLSNEGERCKRLLYTEKVLRYLSQEKVKCKEYDDVENFYIGLLQAEHLYSRQTDDNGQAKPMRAEKLFDMIYEEYTSAEPFLQNVFHIVDIARATNEEIKRDSTTAAASKIMFSQVVDSIRINNPIVKESIRESGRKTTEQVSKTGLRQAQRDSLVRQAEDFVANNAVDTLLQNTREQYKFQAKVEQQAMQMSKVLNVEKLDSIAKSDAWKNVCFGSDFDGMIDPINICPTASQFPVFREKLRVFIPLFLYIRKEFEIRDKLMSSRYAGKEYYFGNGFKVEHALHMLYYENLRKFTIENFK